MDGAPMCPFLDVLYDLHYMQRFPFDVHKVCAMNVSLQCFAHIYVVCGKCRC